MTSRGRMAVGIGVVVAAVAVVVGLVVLSGGDDAAPIGAVAAVQDDHLPVDPIEQVPERIKMVADTGVTTTRVDVFWGDVAATRPADPTDPADPAYDFSRYDLIFQSLAKEGITPIVSTYHTPAWASGGAVEPVGGRINTLAPDPEDYGAFMTALATRYSGGFTSPGGETLPRITHFEIWNEPNLSGFLRPPGWDDESLTADQLTQARLDVYAAMDEAGYAGVKQADPEATVIAGVGGPRSSPSRTGVGAVEWLRGLADRTIPLDAYSQHVYPAAPPLEETTVVPSWSTIGRFLDELDAFRSGLDLYITEAGYTTAATPYRDTGFKTEAEQADYLDQIYSLPQLRSERIKTVVWFNLQDNADWPAGLLREDGSRKPSYGRFVGVVRDQGGTTLG
ncbi:MAG TPA: hypothetical protein PKD59_03910 [Miltoncostaeaceae bacterium]|nr:hypothetical protein [Miltoncostaeaceae bacterium]